MAPKEMIVNGMNEEDLRALIENPDDKRLHIVDVYTNWCGPCQQMVPTFKNLQVNIDFFEDRVTITQIDRDTIPEFKEKYPFTSKPRFLFYQHGNQIKEIEGLNAPEILRTVDEFIPSTEAEDE
eukprot:gnl/MRDRNA2_/MRDRNA2_106591_c0_seq1.p1 gnl/MRDRNA2_/MRDRNA2_106591_c0~~gnl/MRDRNA2_/MRDRNA2_106591_c0_seq1.p1  ORF type:complete len:124 (+),score=26.69 gnl/MRDRNA2_/MRDRNA2_106591_c0_seq1:92-463(+)